MRIAILSKMNHRGGGASRAAEILTHALRARGHEATLFTLRAHEPTPHTVPILPAAIRRPLAFLYAGSEIVTGHVRMPVEWLFLRGKLRGFDLVHVHDTWTALSPWTTRWIAQRWPTCWTFHDCSAFTGGCLYMFDCERHKAACGQCPRKREGRTWARNIDFTRSSLRVKRRVHRGGRYHLVAPSRWIAEKATESGVFSPPVTVIPNGTDMATFHPSRRAAARTRLGIAPHERVVLLSATSLSDRRKGASHGVQALQRLAADGLNPVVVLMGAGGDAIRPQLALRVVDVGYLSAPEKIADAYAASDLFLFPTRADNLPLSIQESMGCGTPVVAYAVGGVPEMIRHGQNGYLVRDGDADGLAEHAAQLVRDAESSARFSSTASAHAQAEWSIDTFCGRHMGFYERILARA